MNLIKDDSGTKTSSNGPPAFVSKDPLHWKLMFTGFLRRFKGANKVLTEDRPEPLSEEEIIATQKKVTSRNEENEIVVSYRHRENRTVEKEKRRRNHILRR